MHVSPRTHTTTSIVLKEPAWAWQGCKYKNKIIIHIKLTTNNINWIQPLFTVPS